VIAVLSLGLEHRERAVGEHRVISPGGQQFLLPGGLVETSDAADDEPGGDRRALLRSKRRVGDFGGLSQPASATVTVTLGWRCRQGRLLDGWCGRGRGGCRSSWWSGTSSPLPRFESSCCVERTTNPVGAGNRGLCYGVRTWSPAPW
jgi:hypothetical protein